MWDINVAKIIASLTLYQIVKSCCNLRSFVIFKHQHISPSNQVNHCHVLAIILKVITIADRKWLTCLAKMFITSETRRIWNLHTELTGELNISTISALCSVWFVPNLSVTTVSMKSCRVSRVIIRVYAGHYYQWLYVISYIHCFVYLCIYEIQ